MIETTTLPPGPNFCVAAGAEDAGPPLAAGLAETAYHLVCRTAFDAPGFCLIDFGPGLSSQVLCGLMVDLVAGMGRRHQARAGRGLAVISATRFDQQATTRPHRDGGPDECLLVLGYEPSPVRSELQMSDYSRCAYDLGLTPAEFLERHNPMFGGSGQRLLAGYTTRVGCFCSDHYQVLLVNNSVAAYSADRPAWQGVLHTATVLNPDAALRRVVNSLMVAPTPPPADAAGPLSEQELREFAETRLVRRRGYDKPELQDDI